VEDATMSGGSFDYACFASDPEGLARKEHNLRALRNALAEYPGSESAVIATDALLARLDALRVALDTPTARELRSVWQAVEWHHSADYGPQQVAEALAKFAALPVAIEQSRAVRAATFVVGFLPGSVDGWKQLATMVAGAVQFALDEEREPRT
jgi:hypothetical protein